MQLIILAQEGFAPAPAQAPPHYFLMYYVFIHVPFFLMLITINCCSVFQLARPPLFYAAGAERGEAGLL